MLSSPLTVDPDRMFSRTRVSAFVTSVLAVASSIWLRVPILYCFLSLVLGVLWFLFMVWAWRSRRRLVFMSGTVMVLGFNELGRACFVPQSLFSLLPGLLVTLATQTVLVWGCEDWIRRVCHLSPSVSAAQALGRGQQP